MPKNEGKWDRIIRVILGLVLLYVGYAMADAPWNYVAYVVGAILLITGAVGYCALYSVFKFSTNKEA
ncbi:MAG TPA: DUF2892 domain-containing protein [Anaerolineae bacterium]|nr:DUF2892 domain-containing protein [Anaerolineae bacterium]